MRRMLSCRVILPTWHFIWRQFLILRWRLGWSIRCQHPGCTNGANPCFLEPWGQPYEYYCFTHAFEHGYCKGCGQFFAGIESFDFGPGYCDNCRAEWEDDLDEDMMEEWDEDEPVEI
jgi:hypothetical protein